ncbi:MAG: sigma-54-dependent transcriptional regulator [Chitinivibrionales bacterium]
MRILVVDDEKDICESLHEIFTEDGYQVDIANDAAQAFATIAPDTDMVILDIKLGEDNGIEVLKKIKQEWPQLPVVMITGFGTVSLAAEAFKYGAHDFLEKPLRLLQIRTCVRNVMEGIRLRKQLAQQQSGSAPQPIYHSEAMRLLYQQAARLAAVREPVAIIGPSGAGKDLLARFLHYQGPRARGPFMVTNAASMPATLAEDELFGHEKGAFTGADKRRIGVIEQAHGGTLFLDEIGDMDLQVQAKILRVLENGELSRLGSNAPVKIDVRLVCATHKNLEELVSRGQFRHDLWYRINAFVLKVPGLDARTEDIPLLADYFLAAVSHDLGAPKQFSSDAHEALKSLSYPGNVRELKHVVTRLAVYCDGQTIGGHHVRNGSITAKTGGVAAAQIMADGGDPSGQPYFDLDFKDAKAAFERDYLKTALARNNGNITATAREIGMAQSNLSRKLKDLGTQI